MTHRTLQEMTDDELIDLLVDLERIQRTAEELLLGRLEARRLEKSATLLPNFQRQLLDQ